MCATIRLFPVNEDLHIYIAIMTLKGSSRTKMLDYGNDKKNATRLFFSSGNFLPKHN